MVIVPPIASDGSGGGGGGTGDGGVTSVAPVGTTPNDAAAIITDTVLQIQPADATHPGVLTATTQDIGGAKTFKTDVHVQGAVDFAGALLPGGAAGTAGQYLKSNGAGVAPTWNDVAAGGDAGVTQVAPVGSAPNAAAAVIAGDTLTLQPASSSFPGVMSAADKTKLDAIAGTNTGDVTLQAVGSAPNGSGASLSGQQLRLQPADSLNPGVVSVDAQEFSGTKTFKNDVIIEGDQSIDGALSVLGRISTSDDVEFSGALMPNASAGTTGQLLKSNGAGVAPTWTDAVDTGVTSLATVGSAPNGSGGSIAGRVLTLQPANATNPGVLTAGAQSIGGAKAFADSISAANLSGINSGDVSLGTPANGLSLAGQAISLAAATTTTPGAFAATDKAKLDGITGSNSGDVSIGTANGLSLAGQVLSLAAASASGAGAVTNGAQTFGGAKTFNGSVQVNGDVGFSGALSPSGSAGTAGQLLQSAGPGAPPVWTSGADTGVTSLAPVGNAPNAEGGSIAGKVLTLQPADATHPGVLTTGAQTIAGAKTFSGAVAASNLSGTNSGDVTIGSPANGLLLADQQLFLTAATAASAGAMTAQDKAKLNGITGNNSGDVTIAAPANGLSLFAQQLSLAAADGSNPGALTAAAQTIGGAKTFSNNIAAANLSGTNTGDVTVGAPANGLAIAGQALTLAAATTSTPGAMAASDKTKLDGINSTGVNSGDVTIGTANGLSLAGQALSLAAATGSTAGALTAAAQTIGGAKTFSGAISASNLSGSNSGDVTIGTANGLSVAGQALSLAEATAVSAGALAATDKVKLNNTSGANSGDVTIGTANGLSVAGQVLSLAAASAASAGAVTTAAQTFEGSKTFNGAVDLLNELRLEGDPSVAGAVLKSSGPGFPPTWDADIGVWNVANVGSSPNAQAATVSGLGYQTLTLQPASQTMPGVLTAAAQTIGGAKTFSGAMQVNADVGFTGALKPGGSTGTAGQFLRSTGAGAPVWSTAFQDVMFEFTMPAEFPTWRLIGGSGQPPFLNGFSNWAGPFTGVAFRMLQDGVVELRGAIKSPPTAPANYTNMFTLPAGYRPIYAPVYIILAGYAMGDIGIDPSNGNVHCGGSGRLAVANQWGALDGIRFQATSAAKPDPFPSPFPITVTFSGAFSVQSVTSVLCVDVTDGNYCVNPTVDWAPATSTTITVRALWGLQPGRQYNLRLRLSA